MKQSEQPLYPKISSIYNKILQLAIAIVFIIVLMNFWLDISTRGEVSIEQHFTHIGDEYLNQASVAVLTLLKAKNKDELQLYIEQLALSPVITSVSIYDNHGQLVTRSASAETINELFGISLLKSNRSLAYVPFVRELRNETLHGYLRISIEKAYLTEQLKKMNNDRQELLRLMLIMAGIVGFLLTRGFSRFSRQGYRPPRVNTAKQK